MNDTTDTGSDYVPARRVLRRYGDISDVTLWRWLRDGVFPPPDKIINKRRYWKLSTLDAHDQAGA